MLPETKTRFSNRVYPERKCLHCGFSFVPKDRRQLYCSKQHKIDAGNDKRILMNRTRFRNEKHLRTIDRTLEALEARMTKLKLKTISLNELLLAGIDRFDLLVEQSQGENNVIIRWFYEYGLQVVDQKATIFRIVKKKQA